MTTTVEYVIIGSGINAMGAAESSPAAGHSVMTVERNDKLGGFIDSGQRTVEPFIHDTCSSCHPFVVSSAAYSNPGKELHRRAAAPLGGRGNGDHRGYSHVPDS